MDAWTTLGIGPTHDIRTIKRAYSVLLKTTRPDDDAVDYQRLREAYESAQQYAKHQRTYVLQEENLTAPLQMSEVEQAEMPVVTEHTAAPLIDVATSITEISYLPVDQALEVANSELSQDVTAESLLKACTEVLAWQGGLVLLKDWPRFQAQLEDLPIAEHGRASQGFAQLAAKEQDIPVEVLIALTRHFQWGLDFRVDRHLGLQLSQALYLRLQQAHVYTAFNQTCAPEDAWALALAKLWDRKQDSWARFLAVCVDPSTRQLILETPSARLQAQGASRAAARATLNFAKRGNMMQALFFALMFFVSAVSLHILRNPEKLFAKVIFTSLTTLFVMIFYNHLYREFKNFDMLWLSLRRWLSLGDRWLDWLVLIPLVATVLCYLDTIYHWLGGYTEQPLILIGLVFLYFGLWLIAPTDEHPWRKQVFPVFILLIYCLHSWLPELPEALLLSMTFAWTIGGHTVMRKFAIKYEILHTSFLNWKKVKKNPLPFIFLLGIWIYIFVICLPILLFRTAVRRGSFYASMAIAAGLALSEASSTSDQFEFLAVWVIVALFFIRILQICMQEFADYCLRRLAV